VVAGEWRKVVVQALRAAVVGTASPGEPMRVAHAGGRYRKASGMGACRRYGVAVRIANKITARQNVSGANRNHASPRRWSEGQMLYAPERRGLNPEWHRAWTRHLQNPGQIQSTDSAMVAWGLPSLSHTNQQSM